MGAIHFIENMDRTTLTISDEEFERNVEAAVSAIAEKHRAESPPPPPPQSEKQTLRPPEPSTSEPRSSGEYGSSGDERPAITGLLRTIQRPLSTIGRIFSDEPSPPSPPPPPPPAAASTSFAAPTVPVAAGMMPHSPARTPAPPERDDRELRMRQRLSAEEAAARQASAEAEEAQRLHRAEHANIVETLAGMFPDLDREVISDVVYQKEGR